MAKKVHRNTRTTRISDARVVVKRAMQRKRPVFLWGGPGIGKSDLVRQITKEFAGDDVKNPRSLLIDVRLALMEPIDLRGMPFLNREANKDGTDDNNMSWAPPDCLPSAELAAKYDKVVLFLDEMNSAVPSVQSAAYQLCLDRAVGNYRLPDNVDIIAAGNRETDRSVTFRMPKALANRFIHLNMDVNFEDWFDWAVRNKIHSDVVGYLTFAKSDLSNFDPVLPESAFASPRTWEFVSDIISPMDGDQELSSAQEMDMVAGTVGEGIALKFVNHRRYAHRLPNPTDILSGKVTEITKKAKEMSGLYSLCINLCYELSETFKEAERKNSHTKYWKQLNNFFTFIQDNFQTEMVILGVQILLTKYEVAIDRRKIKCFDEFFAEHAHLVVEED